MLEIKWMAAYEWRMIRSKRWLLLNTLFYLAVCIGIAYFGSTYAGYSSMQGLKATGISLLNFSLLFIPLMALLAGVSSFNDMRDSWEFLCTQPLSTRELLLGKYIGQLAGLAVPIVCGFGGAALVIAANGSLDGWQEFTVLLLLNLLTAAIFLALSFLLVALCKRSNKVYGWTFALWTGMLLFYDMLVIGIVVLGSGTWQKIGLWTALLLNPADLVRILGISQMGSYDAISATGTLVQGMLQSEGPIWLIVALLLWWLVCLLTSIAVTRRQDLL